MFEVLMGILFSFFINYVLLSVQYPILKKIKAKQTILSYVAEHKQKEGTPTMGGIAFIIGIAITFFILARDKFHYGFFAIIIMLSYAIVGFLDDFIKIKYKRNLGLRAYQKITFQLVIAILAGLYVYYKQGSMLQVPFSGTKVDIGFWIVPLVVVVFLSCTNSVNLTDGLDGLATNVSIMYILPFLVLILFKANSLLDSGRPIYVEYENLYKLCAVIIGALVAFLSFNTFPAKVFMGDTGSLGLGGVLAIIPILSEFSLFIPIIGIMFVFSALSVIIQVFHYKRTKRRVFLKAPLHHHFQLKGIHENRIVYGYSVITLLIGVLAIGLTIFI